MATNSIGAKLLEVQSKLKAPKDQYNSFGGYAYRSAEGVETALKPLLLENGLVLTLSDEIGLYGEYVFCTSTATLTDIDSGASISVSAHAREDATKKGMDGAQISGAASSYARKYALCGLFLIDNTPDNDALEPEAPKQAQAARSAKKPAKKDNQQQLVDEETMTAKKRLWTAIKKYAKAMGKDENEVLTEVLGANEYEATAEYMNMKAFEFETAVG